MEEFTKITVGFVTQAFKKDDKGKFVCTHQEFIAGDQCDYEDAEGNPIEPPGHEYQRGRVPRRYRRRHERP